ncbi:MAG: hypothetical protein JNL67_10950 [Planctomycetaceae bacterium]|nr:hypothetical protein [Planctomycetaceae bacterium]
MRLSQFELFILGKRSLCRISTDDGGRVSAAKHGLYRTVRRRFARRFVFYGDRTSCQNEYSTVELELAATSLTTQRNGRAESSLNKKRR